MDLQEHLGRRGEVEEVNSQGELILIAAAARTRKMLHERESEFQKKFAKISGEMSHRGHSRSSVHSRAVLEAHIDEFRLRIGLASQYFSQIVQPIDTNELDQDFILDGFKKLATELGNEIEEKLKKLFRTPTHENLGDRLFDEAKAILPEIVRLHVDDLKATLKLGQVVPAHVQNFYSAQNIGHIGDVKDKATSMVVAGGSLNITDVRRFTSESRDLVSMLPEAIQEPVSNAVDQIDQETKKETPDLGIVRSIVGSLQAILEGAAGNMAAQGILFGIKNLLS